MRCPKCGQELYRGQTQCPSCGSPVKKRRKGGLWGTIFVILFVLIVSCVLIFMNLKGRGDLPDFSFSSIRSLFVGDKGEASVPSPAEEAQEPAVEPEPAEEAAPAEEQAEEAVSAAEAGTEEAEPADSAEQAGQEPGELSPLEAWRAAEHAHFDTLCKTWDACRDADADAPGQLLSGDARLLLRFCMSTLLDEDLQARAVLNTEDEPESWALFAAGKQEANAAFLPLLASENFTSLLGEYRDLILSAVDTVSVGEELLEAEGILERCPNSFRVDLDTAAVKRIAASLIGALRWDERISRTLDKGGDYQAFLDRLDELDYALDTGALPEGVLHMVLYLDGNGQYRGRSLVWEAPERAGRLVLALPRDDDSFGLDLSVLDADGLRSLSGRGVVTEDAFRGSFRLLRDGKAAAGILAELTE